ncbi:hypothetical protein RhiirA5_493640 [Rhizophagus irregularis]|uniref:TPR-like protein n=1 Tax=Rhizophagus irregularis TaxID=588596 RepID=A0A2I1EDM0_9GLOM|nr:hypothetical protein RhiirA5_493640 [Rhizophagus irregularis]GBC33085.1 hypothetical protein GLOIN_2v1766653 [Rhizophagus irregularis DAOM 181602=DAOM 197198]PKC72078.1 hypothetical protein RhiirA1_531515 [Rhizophagus irregularis]PKY20197.1 hypothetical protein RhiirB3_524122 [Rhizophagus irregularis]UZO15908.1 hypothetical protein OCT59_007318 [Rhizophagus irregularis]
MVDSNHEIQSDPVNDELFLDFFNFDFNFEDQDKKKRKKIINETSQNNFEYIPKHDYDGWFHTFIPVPTLLRSKEGPSQLKQSIEHLYFHRKFEESLRLSLEFIEFIEKYNGHSNEKEFELHNPNKLNNTREMLEIASRSALQLGDVKLAVNCVNKLISNEPGHMQLRGIVYAKGGHYADSIYWYIKYLQVRNNDYKIWKEMGHTFLYCYCHSAQLDTANIMKTIQEISHNTLTMQLALICINHAYRLMLKTSWATSISYINSRFAREKQEIEDLSSYLEKGGVNVEETMSLLDNLKENRTKENIIAENGLEGFDLEMIRWILVESKISVYEMYLVDQERLAKDL